MQRKAQAEFALILGLLIIAIVAGIYAYSTVVPPAVQPSALTEEQKAVDTYMKDVVRKAAAQALDKMYDQGGYVDMSNVQKIEYGGNDIAYWQMCGTMNVPDVEVNLERGVEGIIKSMLPAMTDIAGKRIVFDKSRIVADARLFENRITLSVTIPTTIEGRAMPQPYSIDLRSNLGRVYGFAMDFTRLQGTYRALDYNLLRLIRRSNPQSCWLPTKGVAFKGSFDKSWTELRDCMMQLIFHNLANTYEWEKPVLMSGVLPKNMLDKSWIFQIVRADGSWGQYAEMDVDFYYGGGDEKLTRNNPQLLFGTSPDPVHEKGKSFSMIGYTIGPMLAYDVKYNVAFPVIVSVWDPLMERSFKFTNFVNIQGNEISGSCRLDAVSPGVSYNRCVRGATEPMSLTVNDHEGSPLSAVDVWFDGCGPWRVFGGSLQVNVPAAGNAELRLLHEFSGSEYSECTSSSELRSKTVALPIKRIYDANFYVVRIGKSPFRILSVQQAGNENVTAFFIRPGNACMNSSYVFLANFDLYGGRVVKSGADLYPTVSYGVNITTGSGSAEMEGFAVEDETGDINIYAPSVEGFSAGDEANIRSLYAKCGMSPVSTELYTSKAGCSL